MRFSKLFLCAVSAAGFFMSATSCFASSKFTAVATMAAGDFSSGAHATVTTDKPRAITENMAPSGSDMTVVSRGRYFYRMERSGSNSITKFDINDPATPVWQFSTEGSETGSNPHDLVFVNDSLAYLLRYGSSIAWIVNPSATKQENFKIGELDLSAYADGDGKPEMHSGVIIGEKLFITLQRIDFTGGWGKYVYNTSYVAVFNALTGAEITTGKGGIVKGIEMPMENPNTIQAASGTGYIYVQFNGQYNKKYTGGITMIDPDNYESAVLFDDGSEIVHPYGAITGMVIVSAKKGYFTGYNGWGDNNLYAFNPASFLNIATSVPGFEGKNISGLEPSSLDRKGMVWVSTSDLDPVTYGLGSPAIRIVNPDTDIIDESVPTSLVAQKFAFCDGSPGSVSDDDDSSSGSCFISTMGADFQNSNILFAFIMSVLFLGISGISRRRR